MKKKQVAVEADAAQEVVLQGSKIAQVEELYNPVTGAMPAPASRLSGETPKVCNTPKLITGTAITPMKNCRTVTPETPMRAVMNGFALRINSRIISQKPTIMMIRKVSLENIDRLIGAAKNWS